MSSFWSSFFHQQNSRIKKLIDMDALLLSRLQVIVLDMQRDAKGFSLFTLPQVRLELRLKYTPFSLLHFTSFMIISSWSYFFAFKYFAALSFGTCTKVILMRGFFKAILRFASMAMYLVLRRAKFVKVMNEHMSSQFWVQQFVLLL